MSATPNQPVTHDVGARISWTLRPVVSKKLENWEKRREAMKDTCRQCHGPDFVDAFYVTFDQTVDMWNEKFAVPAQDVMNALRAAKKLTPTPFDEELEWTFYRLWHHEGRRARMGASMQGPDYTQWHGFFEVAENFYTKFLPQAREAAHGDATALAGVILGIADQLKISRLVQVIIQRSKKHKGIDATFVLYCAEGGTMSPEERARIEKFYQERYGATPR